MFIATGFNQQDIVKDGLVLWLDANDKTSYPGDGTIWRDLSRGGNNGTLTNGPTYNSENGGSIVFDGVNDYCWTDNINSLPSGGTARTMCFWVNPSNVAPPLLYPIFGFGLNSGSGGFFMGCIFSNAAIFLWGNTINYTSTFTLSVNTWAHVTYIYANNYITVYKNGVPDAGSSITLDTIANSPIQMADVQSNPYSKLPGKIANGYIYNRALSAQEVLQNYNATKNRFGL
jgi:hypothetical protein